MAKHNDERILSRLQNKPIAHDIHSQASFEDSLTRLSAENLNELSESDNAYQILELANSYFATRFVDNGKPYAYADGIAVIPVHGSLINRFPYSLGFITGYQYIANMIQLAIADIDVKGIVLDINSHGGECAGCFELADLIRESSSIKPIVSFVDSNGHSAAYAIASAASKIYVTESASVGSVGVVAAHFDYSKMMDEVGVKVTFIFAGDHKVDGNPYQELSGETKDRIQASVDRHYDNFVSRVSSFRSLDRSIILNTKADVFDSQSALELGLIDGIMTPAMVSNVFTQFKVKGSKMAESSQVPSVDIAAVTQTAKKEERDRISAITMSPNAKGRSNLANHLAFNTNMSAEDADSLLAVAAVEVAPKDDSKSTSAADAFVAAMDATKIAVVSDLDVSAKVENPLIAARNKALGK